MLKSFYSFILTFDAVGPIPELNYKGQPRYFSLLGVILTFLAFFGAILTMKFTILAFFNKNNPDIFVTDNYNEDESVTFNNNNYKFYLNVVYLDQIKFIYNYIDQKEFDAPDLLTIKSNTTGYYQNIIGKMERCSQEVFENYNSGFISDNIYSESEIEYFRSNSLCFPNNITLNLTSRLNYKEIVQMGLPFESFSELVKKYEVVAIVINYK